jgi:hypothetical protein
VIAALDHEAADVDGTDWPQHAGEKVLRDIG